VSAVSGDAVLPAAAILFDCDGVLVDSDASIYQSWSRWALHYGLDPAQFEEMEHGRRAADTVRQLLADDLVAEGIELIDTFELEDVTRVVAVPGAGRLLERLPPDIWAVVTSGTTLLASARLQAAGLPFPRVLVTADDVKVGKPAPDCYLIAARRLGCAPAQAVVLEDSPSGIEAARAAGVGHVVGVGARALSGDVDLTVGDLSGLSWQSGVLRIDRSKILPGGEHGTAGGNSQL
jgi:sugar-phosphatase